MKLKSFHCFHGKWKCKDNYLLRNLTFFPFNAERTKVKTDVPFLQEVGHLHLRRLQQHPERLELRFLLVIAFSPLYIFIKKRSVTHL